MIRVFFAILFLTTYSCSPNSAEDFQKEGRAITLSITKEVKKVRSKGDLLKRKKRLESLFDHLVETMIEADEKLDQTSAQELSQRNIIASQKLKKELERIYSIDGCTEIIEKIQEPSLHKLDAYVKKKQKRQAYG